MFSLYIHIRYCFSSQQTIIKQLPHYQTLQYIFNLLTLFYNILWDFHFFLVLEVFFVPGTIPTIVELHTFGSEGNFTNRNTQTFRTENKPTGTLKSHLDSCWQYCTGRVLRVWMTRTKGGYKRFMFHKKKEEEKTVLTSLEVAQSVPFAKPPSLISISTLPDTPPAMASFIGERARERERERERETKRILTPGVPEKPETRGAPFFLFEKIII